MLKKGGIIYVNVDACNKHGTDEKCIYFGQIARRQVNVVDRFLGGRVKLLKRIFNKWSESVWI